LDTITPTIASEPRFRTVDREAPRPHQWTPLLVPCASIDEASARLQVEDGAVCRAVEIVHPQNPEPEPSLAPGFPVSVNLLNLGQEVTISRVEFCIRGSGQVIAGGRTLSPTKFDIWDIPSILRRRYCCDGREAFVWLSYSNAPLLQKLGIHYSDEGNIQRARPKSEREAAESKYARQRAPDIAILATGTCLCSYEFLTDIEVVENKPLIWPWCLVSPHVSMQPGDEKRTIMLCYKPAMKRRNGTTHSFFATVTSWLAGNVRPVPARGHKHSSLSCNYHFRGRRSSIVDGQRFGWEDGDLMLSAPSWSEHAHGSSIEGPTVLTVQDYSFQIGTECLVWQERIDGPVLTIGSEAGQKGYVGPWLKGEQLQACITAVARKSPSEVARGPLWTAR